MDAFVTRLPNPAKAASAATAASPPAVAAAPNAAAKPMSSHKRARVPDDLDGLSRDALVGLVNDLARERDALERAAKTARTVPTPETQPAARPAKKPAAKTVPKPAPSAVGGMEIDALRARLAKKAIKAIKKAKHNERRKPYTTVTEGVASKEVALRLMRGHEPHLKSDTARMTRWILGPDEAIEAIGADLKLIHPVANDVATYCGPDDDGYVYCAAKIDSLEVKYEPAASLLSLKFRTCYAGSGRPPHMVLVEDEDKDEDDVWSRPFYFDKSRV